MEQKSPSKRTVPLKDKLNTRNAQHQVELAKLTVQVFSTPLGEALLKEMERHYIMNRRFTDHRFPNIGYENEGAAEVVRTIRFALEKEAHKNAE